MIACRSFSIQNSYDLWLDPGMQDASTVSDMLKPSQDDQLDAALSHKHSDQSRG